MRVGTLPKNFEVEGGCFDYQGIARFLTRKLANRWLLNRRTLKSLETRAECRSMRDAAAAAAMSDPVLNRWFCRRRVAAKHLLQSTSAEHKNEVDNQFQVIGNLLLAWRRDRATWAASADRFTRSDRSGKQ